MLGNHIEGEGLLAQALLDTHNDRYYSITMNGFIHHVSYAKL